MPRPFSRLKACRGRHNAAALLGAVRGQSPNDQVATARKQKYKGCIRSSRSQAPATFAAEADGSACAAGLAWHLRRHDPTWKGPRTKRRHSALALQHARDRRAEHKNTTRRVGEIGASARSSIDKRSGAERLAQLQRHVKVVPRCLQLQHVAIYTIMQVAAASNETATQPPLTPTPEPESSSKLGLIVIAVASTLLCCILMLLALAIVHCMGYTDIVSRDGGAPAGEDLSKTFNHSLVDNVSVVDEEVEDIGGNARDVVTVDNDMSSIKDTPDRYQVTRPTRRAALQTLADGRQVIHVANPRLQRTAGSLMQLAEAYLAVIRQAVLAVAKPGRKSSLMLRMEPLGLGYGHGMEKLTFAALSLAFHWLGPNELDWAENIRLQFCVPVPEESESETDTSDEEGYREGERIARKRDVNPKLNKVGCCGRGCGKHRSAIFESYFEALRTWQASAGLPPSGTGQLPKQQHAFSWVWKGTSDRDRRDRLGAFCITRNAITAGAYGGGTFQQYCGACCGRKGNAPAGRISTRGLIEKTQVISALSLPQLPANPNRKTVVQNSDKLLLDAAERELSINRNAKICAVSAAAGYQAGGAFTTGGRHALEEATCVQSTLYQSLESVLEASIAGGLEVGKRPYFDQKSAILSPNVDVFREGSNRGYEFKKKPFELNIVSIFMPNKNPQMKDAPVDAPRDPAAYKALVAGKMQALLHAAVLSGSDVLVCPDVGCGVFENDATEVGHIAGEEMRKMMGYFSKIVLVGKLAFIEAAMKVMVPTQQVARQPVKEEDDTDSLPQGQETSDEDEKDILVQVESPEEKYYPTSGSVSAKLGESR